MTFRSLVQAWEGSSSGYMPENGMGSYSRDPYDSRYGTDRYGSGAYEQPHEQSDDEGEEDEVRRAPHWQQSACLFIHRVLCCQDGTSGHLKVAALGLPVSHCRIGTLKFLTRTSASFLGLKEPAVAGRLGIKRA